MTFLKSIIIGLCFLNVMVYSQDINQYLEAHWDFEDSTARDVTGHGYDGKLMNNPLPVAGVHNQGTAFYFNGKSGDVSTGSHILLPSVPFESFGEFTITMWVYEALNSISEEAYIFFGDHNNGWLGIMNMSGKRTDGQDLYNHIAVGAAFDVNIEPLKIKSNNEFRERWLLYILVYRNDTLFSFLNGNKIGELKQDVRIYGTKAALGRHWWWGLQATSTRFTGAIDEVRIYTRALKDDEIKKLYDDCSNGVNAFSLLSIKPKIDLVFDTITFNQINCKTVEVKNTSEEPAILNAYMFEGVAFSIPQSQLPMLVAPGDTARITVCFSPTKQLEADSMNIVERDTLYIIDTCGKIAVPVKGTGGYSIHEFEGACGTTVYATTKKLPDKRIFQPSEAYPNPATNQVFVPFELENDNRVIEKCFVYSVIGEKVLQADAQITQLTANSVKGFFEINVSTLTRGLYYYVIHGSEHSSFGTFILE